MFITRPSPWRTPARAGTSGRAAAPGGRPRRGCRPRRARRPAPSTSARSRRARGAPRCSPPGARSSETASPDAVSIVTPARPGRVLLGRLELDPDLLPAAARVADRARRRERASELRLPAQARRQPAAEQQRGGERVLPVADGDRGDAAERRAQRRRVERGGHALAPRRRAQPREVDHVGVLGRARRRGRSDSATSGSSWRVDEHDLRQPAQRVDRLGVAVRRPHHRRQVGDQQRVDDRVELGQVARRRSRSPRARARPRCARAAARRRRCRRPPTRRSSSRPSSTAHSTSRDGW